VQVLKLLHHPYIAELKEIIEDEEEEKIYLCILYFMQFWSMAPVEKSRPGRRRPKDSPSTSILSLHS
jgi:predicted dehydrogenase